jgi:hypothetical protein
MLSKLEITKLNVDFESDIFSLPYTRLYANLRVIMKKPTVTCIVVLLALDIEKAKKFAASVC